METPKNKKDSVFSGIFPASEPAPQSAPAVQVPRPVVSDDQVAVLNKKIELMERNIVERLEKKVTEQPASPVIAQQPGLVPEVVLKITEMENRMKDFQEKFLQGAAQMKNIEESKISARREIEELLKVVREQQKYSELDRQMHDQLEKAWLRVEELERRMMEVYSAAAKKTTEPAVSVVSAPEVADEVMKIAGPGIDLRIKSFETRLKIFEGSFEAMITKNMASSEASRVVAASVKELHSAIDARLEAFASDHSSRQRIEAFAGKERLDEALLTMKRELIDAAAEGVERGAGAFVKHVDTAALDQRERVDAMSKMMVSHMDQLSEAHSREAAKMEALEARFKADNESARAAIAVGQAGVEKIMRELIETAAQETRAENARQLERVRQEFNLSASNLAAMSVAAAGISELETRLGGILAGLKDLVKNMGMVNLDGILGVSGAMIRKSFQAASGLICELEKETVLIAENRTVIDSNIRGLRSKSGE